MTCKKFSIFLAVIMLFSALSTFFAFSAAPIEIATIGDSITWGSCSGTTVGSRDNHQTYQAHLAKSLCGSYTVKKDGDTLVYTGNGYVIKNYGVSGQSVLPDPVYLAQGNTKMGKGANYNPYIQSVLKTSPDVVLIMLGTNDSKTTLGSKVGVWSAPTGGADNFYNEYYKLVKTFCDIPSKPQVYIMTPPPALDHGFANRDSYRITNSIQEEFIVPILYNISDALGVPLLDVRSAFPQPTSGIQRTALAKYLMDCVHPNASGYALLGKTVAEALVPGSTTSPSTPSTPSVPSTPSTPSNPKPSTPAPSNPSTPNTPTTPNNQSPSDSTTQPTQTFSVEYDAQGASGDCPIDSTAYAFGDTATVQSADTLTLDGAVFLGWSLIPDQTEAAYQPGDTITIQDNLTFYAVWTRITTDRITLTLTLPGGEKMFLEAEPGLSISLPDEAALDYDRTLYQFIGWSLEEGGAKINTNTLIVESSQTLYALYQELTPLDQDFTSDEPNPSDGSHKSEVAQKSFIEQHKVLLIVGSLALFLLSSGAVLLAIFLKKKKRANTPVTPAE